MTDTGPQATLMLQTTISTTKGLLSPTDHCKDVLDCVFDYIHARADMYACLTTCKVFHSLILPKLYCHIAIYFDERFNQRLAGLLIKGNPGLRHIKTKDFVTLDKVRTQ